MLVLPPGIHITELSELFIGLCAILVAQLVNNPHAMRETWVRSLGWEDPLEKGKATHCSILAWGIPWTMGSQRVGHDWVTFTFTFHLVAQLCLTLCNPRDYSPPGSSVHGILQARILEWVAMPSSRGSSQHRDQTQVSHTAGGFFPIWATREAQDYNPQQMED